MSVKSDIWVSAYRRRCDLEVLPCVIVRKGALDAGSIYVCIRISDDEVWLMGPPAGPLLDDRGDRIFEPRFETPVPQGQIDEYLARQAGYDPDIWVLEVEDRDGRAFLR
ncbi:DUF1491 family protein [Anderseniella sp. Alg231-50]|uniref:DUF1491 family protein n=1 Tax=Anderseniella sp. Alg231-50 TaxID=1922226 RepID=UPI000D55C6B0